MSIRTQMGAAAIRPLFAIVIIPATFSVISGQSCKMTRELLFRDASGFILAATASALAETITAIIMIGSEKDIVDRALNVVQTRDANNESF